MLGRLSGGFCISEVPGAVTAGVVTAISDNVNTRMETEMQKEVARINADMQKEMTEIRSKMELEVAGIRAEADKDMKFTDEASEVLTAINQIAIRRRYVTDDGMEIDETLSPYAMLEFFGLGPKLLGSLIWQYDYHMNTEDNKIPEYNAVNVAEMSIKPRTFLGVIGRELFKVGKESWERADKLTRIYEDSSGTYLRGAQNNAMARGEQNAYIQEVNDIYEP